MIAWVQNLCNGYFYPKTSVHVTVSLHMLRACSGGLSVLEFRTQSQNEQASPCLFDYAAQIQVRIFLKDGALSSLSNQKNTRQIYATQKIVKSRPIFKHFPNGFSGRSTLACVAALDASISMLMNLNCKRIISVLSF